MELHGYVEPCTVSNAQDMYMECEQCPVPGHDSKACDRLGQLGYKKNCRTRGDRAGWDEVWCIARGTQVAAPTGHTPTAALLAAGAALVVVVSLSARAWSRRRRNRG